MSEFPMYVLERVFNAPRNLVWRTWTDPDLVSRWYGPNVETIVHRLELKTRRAVAGGNEVGRQIPLSARGIHRRSCHPNDLSGCIPFRMPIGM